MPPPAVVVSALGPLRVTVGDTPADLGGRRQRAVLARLIAAGGEVVSTDRIIDDLWSGEPPPTALAALQVHVSNLRRALEPERRRRTPATVLVSVAPGYALTLTDDAVDVRRFEGLLSAAAAAPDTAARRALLDDALNLWSGPAYAEFADTAWAAPEGARLAELRLTAIESRAAADLELGAGAGVISVLERHLHDHPLREEAVRLLVLALYRAGRQADALAVLRRARERLSEELGVDPGPALRRLETDVLNQSPVLDDVSPPPPASPAAPRPTGGGGGGSAGTAAAGRGAGGGGGAGAGRGGTGRGDGGEPPAGGGSARGGLTSSPVTGRGATVVGRAPELARIDAAAESARDGARLVWIGGEAGAGKTTLAGVAADRLAARDWRTAWGRVPEVDGAPPAWAWDEVVAALDGEPPRAPGQERPTAFWLARSVAGRLAAAAEKAPLVVVLDDVHRADSVTLQLLRQVVHELARNPVLFVVTYRPSEGSDELAAAWAVLASTTADRLEVAGLNDAGVAELARESGLDPDPATLRLLSERTGGNPLFVRELARLLAAEGKEAGRVVPAEVREVLRRRIERLPGTARAALRQASVLGRDVDVDLLAEMWGRDEDELLDGLEAAVLAGLLSEPGPGQVRFTHALVRDVLYDDIPLIRRTRLHASALAVIEQRTPDDADALAHHALAGATRATAGVAVRYAAAAAERATALSGHAEAAQLWSAAVSAHELSGVRDDRRLLGLLLPLVGALARSGDVMSARKARDRAVELASALDDDALLLEALVSWRAPVTWTITDAASRGRHLGEVMRTALRDLEMTGATRARLLCSLFFEIEGVPGDRGELAALTREALELARRGDDDEVLCVTLNAHTYVALGPDLAAEREPSARELLAVATRAGLLGYQAVGHWLCFLSAAARTDLAEARRQAEMAIERSASGQLGQVLGVVTVFTAVLNVVTGRLDEARSLYQRVFDQLDENGDPNAWAMQLMGRVTVDFARGDLAERVAELETLHAGLPDAMPELLVLALLDAGREADARSAWRPELDLPRDYYWLARQTLFAHAAARLGDVEASGRAYAALLPFAGTLGGIDSGSVVFGTVDAALAVLAEVLGRPADAARHREASTAVESAAVASLA